MTSYSATLLPPSPPYCNLDRIITALCDNCLVYQYNKNISKATQEQHFDLTMKLIEFWCLELSEEEIT